MSRKRRAKSPQEYRREERLVKSISRNARFSSPPKASRLDLTGLFPHELQRFHRNERLARLGRFRQAILARPPLLFKSRLTVVGEPPVSRRPASEFTRAKICAERRSRRETLHAYGLTGKGSGGGPKTFSSSSKVRC